MIYKTQVDKYSTKHELYIFLSNIDGTYHETPSYRIRILNII